LLLKQGDSGDSVKALQRGLNKLGELVLVDGEFGMGTAAAVTGARQTLKLPGPPVADDAFQQAVLAAPDPFPPLTAAGVTFIAREEVSDGTTYRKKFQRPCLPPSPSGITIGIGYDCRFTKTRADLEADWGDVLAPDAIALLVPTLGVVGTQALLAQANGVSITLGDAMRVFAQRSLPKYLEETRRIYPQIAGAALNPAQRTALVSLVYNRGTDLTGDRRTEMKAIQGLLAAGRLADVPDQFESMTRLWTMTEAPGLIRRRRTEATLFRAGFAAVQLD
jgi:peptidoglycan hydrolase-like protein with peptidoglycan-binding domain